MKIALKAGIRSHAMGKRKRERPPLPRNRRRRPPPLRRLLIDELKSSRRGRARGRPDDVGSERAKLSPSSTAGGGGDTDRRFQHGTGGYF